MIRRVEQAAAMRARYGYVDWDWIDDLTLDAYRHCHGVPPKTCRRLDYTTEKDEETGERWFVFSDGKRYKDERWLPLR